MSNQDVKQLRSMALQYFQCISAGQNFIQCIKQALFLHEKFNPLIMFDLISEGRQVQTRKDWRNYLQSINVQFGEEELSYLFSHHHFGDEVRFHQFLEAIMPFNADILRIFKRNYIQQVQIQRKDEEVQCIFEELIKFWIIFFGNLTKIKKNISSIATNSDIIQLIKNDLIWENRNRNMIRESGKYKQKFQSPEYQLGFDDLRRFLEFWVTGEEKNIQFQLLQIKRHFGEAKPFHLIGRRHADHKSSPNKRAISAKKISNKKNVTFSTGVKQRPQNEGFQSANRYQDFKSQLMRGLNRQKNQQLSNKFQNVRISDRYQQDQVGLPSGLKNNKKTERKSLDAIKNYERQDNTRHLRYARDKTLIKGEHIIRILQQISFNEEKIQRLRKKLAGCYEFNLINLFKLIDSKNKGYVTARNIQQFAKTGKDQDFSKLIQWHAREKDKLRFQDFCMIFRPLSKKLNEALDQKPQNNLPNPFKRETLSIINEILTLSTQMFETVHHIKEKINDEGVRVSNLFRYVDIKNKGYIEADDIKNLLQENNIQCDQRNLKCVMKIFKKRLNEKIHEQEFQKFIEL